MWDTTAPESHPGHVVADKGMGGGVEFCFGMQVGLYFHERPAVD
jgi:hypothetical protein